MAGKKKKMGTVKEIIILHGWAYTTEKWGKFLQQLKGKGFKPNLLKIPGLTQKTNKVWDLDDYVEWLKKKVGSKNTILLGHSNGGRIALSFASKYPQKLSKLILIDSAGIYHNKLTLTIKRKFFESIAKVGKTIFPKELLKTILYKIVGESDYRNAGPIQRQTMLNLISMDLTPSLKNISTPTLIIWGKDDKVTPLSDGKLMHKLVKNSKLFIIDNAKHSPQFTHPKEVAKIIYEYL